MRKLMMCSAVALAGAALFAAPKVSDATLVRVSPMGLEPTIDGTISYDEEHGSTMQYGAISDETGIMALRLCVFHFGYSEQGVYFAARTSVPEKPQTLNADDTVTLELLLPGAAEAKLFSVRVMDGKVVEKVEKAGGGGEGKILSASRTLPGTRDYGVLCAETELFVPYEVLGGAFREGDKLGLQMHVNFSSKKEHARWHYCKSGGKVEGWNSGKVGDGKGGKVGDGKSEELGTLIIDKTAATPSVVNFYTLEQYRASGNYRPFFRFNNKYGKEFSLKSKSVVYRGIGFSKLDSDPELNQEIAREKLQNLDNLVVKAGECAESIYFLWVVNSGAVAVMNLDVSDGAPLFKRQIRWDMYKGLKWVDPIGLPTVKSAFFPCRNNLLRIEFNPNKADDLSSGTLRVVGVKAGKTYWQTDLAKGDKVPYVKFNFNLPDLPEDKYEVRFEGSNGAGRTYRDKSTFEVASFPWQKARVGQDRIVVPPYVPIKVEKWNGGKVEKWKGGKVEGCDSSTVPPLHSSTSDTISFLQTAYQCGGILWDRILAKGEDLLAGPVTMKMNGQDFTVTGVEYKEIADDRVVREVTAEMKVEKWESGKVEKSTSSTVPPSHSSTVTLRVTQDYDYDGYCKVRFAYSSAEPFEVKSLQLRIPLKNELAKYFNTLNPPQDVRSGPALDRTLPTGEGEVWNAKWKCGDKWRTDDPGVLQSYIWWGGVYKGMCYVIDSSRYMSLKKGVPAQRIVRKDGAATLECDFVTVPVKWRGERVFEMAFQPTPVKPKVPGLARLAERMYQYRCPSNAVRMACSWDKFQLSCMHNPHGLYPNGDTSLRDWTYAQPKIDEAAYLAKVDEYVARNARALSENRSTSLADYRAGLRREARMMGIDLNLTYMDPMLITSFWPEWEMYKSEWWPLEWPRDNYLNEYMAQVSDSRIDKLMWDGMKTLEGGSWGLYYDCFRNCGAYGLGSPNVYFRENGTLQPQLSNAHMWRQIMKRSAVICYKMGRTFCGIPCVEDHDTNCNYVPQMSFCMTGLSTERGARGGVLPIRFCESYTLVNVIGAQSGKGTRSIVKAHMGDIANQERELKSLMGWMCAYGIFAIADQGTLYRPWFDKAWNAVFDFGWGLPEVKQSYYWDDQPKPVTHTGKDIRLTVGSKKGAALLMFGNLGAADTDVTFDIAGLNLGKNVKYIDMDTDKPIDGSKIRIDGYGYRMIRVEKK